MRIRILPILAVLFLLLPLVEIYFMIQVGGVIGAFPTILLVVATSLLGAYLLRQQGLSTLTRFQQEAAKGKPPIATLLEGVVVVLGGILMLIPGFLSDMVGLFCLLPLTRRWLARFLLLRFAVKASPDDGSMPVILEGDYTRKDKR